jgi:GNAT superfamily N-acetyltransferase
VQSSPFDTDALGVPTARLEGLYALSAEAARELVASVVEATRDLGASMLLGRVAPASPALDALLGAGLRVFGATVLYAGAPTRSPMPAAIEVADGPEAIAEAATVVGLAFGDTHLSRDRRIGPKGARSVYERWVSAEARRGATILIVREERGQPAAVAVCRQNVLAQRHLAAQIWSLHLLATHPDWSGRGYGSRVVRAALSHAAGQGAALVQTGADTAAIQAQRIYSSLGLRPASASLALHGWID